MVRAKRIKALYDFVDSGTGLRSIAFTENRTTQNNETNDTRCTVGFIFKDKEIN